MKAYIFPGQGSQFPGMGKDLYENSEKAKKIIENADNILGFNISNTIFNGSEDELKKTKITQPAIFIHSLASVAAYRDNFNPDMVAGHSLGEFSALAAAGALSFEDALKLVYKRAIAMQKACELKPSTMAAVLGTEYELIEEVCNSIEDEVVVPANYNSPGQVVISGSIKGVEKACELLTEKGAKRTVILNVGGAFHSPLMEPAREELAEAIEKTTFEKPICPVYQNVTANAVTDPQQIKNNLLIQLTHPVKWTQSMEKMIQDGATSFYEVGPGKVLILLIKKINRNFAAYKIEDAIL